MMHIALFRLKGNSSTRQAERERLRESTGKRLRRAVVPGNTLTQLVGMDEPREMNLYREGDDYSPPHDFAFKAQFSSADALIATIEETGLPEKCVEWTVWEVEVSEKKARESPADGTVPGIHMLHPLWFHDDLPRSVLLRSWREIHGDLALRVHVGSNMYCQNLVTSAVVPGSAAPYGGFSEFHFPSYEALRDGYFDSDRGRTEIRHDIRHFIKGVPPRFFAHEYRLTNV
ncbi:hypothetical protein [Burkholderia multivorans]|uniref:hypothetical protein n=1 Tax=Burkholderia multivorans TaxID=87883 RepID=UPI001C23AF5A|nr:hypothetical protein [Burkholderia multivorans]MBU9477691.1 hypothetical protein [Burkholderia multivorans]